MLHWLERNLNPELSLKWDMNYKGWLIFDIKVLQFDLNLQTDIEHRLRLAGPKGKA